MFTGSGLAVRRKKLSQKIADDVLLMIADRGLSHGDPVPSEGELASMFQVSRTPIREAIKVLTALGAVRVVPGKGIYVQDTALGPLRSSPGVGEDRGQLLLDIMEFRQIVEPEIAALAALRRTAADLVELEHCVTSLEAGLGRVPRPAEDLGFHTALARATRNSALNDVSSMVGRFYENDPHLPDETDAAAHRAVFEAVRAGDAAAARHLMMQHLVTITARQLQEST